jgi:hypothetical protein
LEIKDLFLQNISDWCDTVGSVTKVASFQVCCIFQLNLRKSSLYFFYNHKLSYWRTKTGALQCFRYLWKILIWWLNEK